MKRKRLGKGSLLQVFFVLAVICQANATIVDVCDGTFTISDGDDYDTVNVFNDASITMTGGQVLSCHTYESGTLLYSGGDIYDIWVYNSSIAYVETDFCQAFEIYDYGQIHMNNGPIGASIFIYDDAQLHIYGYNLYYDEIPAPDWITGQWENGQGFKLILRNINGYNPNQVFLHEIPEPVSIMLFAFGGLLLRRTRM